ncbi:thymic stromal cotransporter homolog isoform X2 [Dunckerocampus dactyliophorus]|uniref:thymic stromal cotransporter homolog isoform X2 n=1 Tax=Dunckerocampus dactyliophorus TaxID=161453 RepID=UPI0024076CBD|nr:thymic stromal cotransporter homolog isoform X2 [Dunckerocampus dactyliophorus]
MHGDHSLWGIQLVAAGVQLGNSFFLTVLPMVVKERYIVASNSTQADDSWQISVSSFFMTYRVLSQLVPILPGFFLAWLGDIGWRKSLIAVPLLGLMLSRLVLLLMLLRDWPLEVLWVEVLITALCGGSTVFWSGIMTLLSLSSTGRNRSKLLMRAELISGISGVVGCMTGGHLYDLSSPTVRPGVITFLVCLLLHAFCMLYIIFFLQLMEPLHWNVTQVGYGNASGFLVMLSSFLSTVILSRWFSDRTLITIGLISNAAGMLLMAFVTTTYMFFLARALTLFSKMPVVLISSQLSQQVHSSSYGKVLTSLQISLKVSSAGCNLLYGKIYQQTLSWFPGFVLTLSSIASIVTIVPVRIFDSRLSAMCSYTADEEADQDDILPLTNSEDKPFCKECASYSPFNERPE